MPPDKFYSRRQVLVCGGAGFLGTHLVAALISAGANVTVLDPCMAGSGGRELNLAALSDRIRWLRVSTENETALMEAVEWSHLVFDAMGFTRHHAGLADPLFDMKLNYLSHLQLSSALNKTPRPLAYLGSRGQFGRVADTLTEESPQVPLDPQGVHKSAAEALLRIYSVRSGYPVLSARLDNCFGPGQLTDGDDIGLVGSFIRSLCAGERVNLYGDAERTRNLAYGPDVARWLLEAASNMSPGFSAINMFGDRVRLTKLLDLIIAIVGRGGYEITPFPWEVAMIEAAAVDISRATFLRHVPNPEPTPLDSALARTTAYFAGEAA